MSCFKGTDYETAYELSVQKVLRKADKILALIIETEKLPDNHQVCMFLNYLERLDDPRTKVRFDVLNKLVAAHKFFVLSKEIIEEVYS